MATVFMNRDASVGIRSTVITKFVCSLVIVRFCFVKFDSFGDRSVEDYCLN